MWGCVLCLLSTHRSVEMGEQRTLVVWLHLVYILSIHRSMETGKEKYMYMEVYFISLKYIVDQ